MNIRMCINIFAYDNISKTKLLALLVLQAPIGSLANG